MVTNILKFDNKPHFGQGFDKSHWARKGLIAHWPMIKFGKAIDVSSNGNHGDFSGGVIWKPNRGSWATDYDGSTGYMDCGNDSIFDLTTEITLIIKVNPDVLAGTTQNIICKYDSAESDAANFIMDNQSAQSGRTRFAIHSNADGWTVWGADSVISVGVSTVVVITYNGAAAPKIYADGISLSVSLIAGSGNPSMAANNANVIIGANDFATPSQFYNGRVEYCRIYNRVLSPSEVMELYRDPYPEYYTDIWWMGRVAVVGTWPHNPLGHPLVGALGGPI